MCIAQGLEVDVEDYGAVASSQILSGPAINAAISAVSAAGGGIVHARQGSYLTGGVELKSNVELRIAYASSLIGSGNKSHWLPRNISFPLGCDSWFHRSLINRGYGGLIWAQNATNFSITGGGLLDGAGLHFNHLFTERSNMFVFISCSDVVVQDLHIRNSSAWTLNPMFSKRLRFQRLHISQGHIPDHHSNTDGFNPTNSEDVEFLDSYYEGPGDDCVAIKSGLQVNGVPFVDICNRPSRNIRINNITCIAAHGITIGSEVSGGIENVTFTNSQILNYVALGVAPVKFKSSCGRGAYIRNIFYENMTARNVGQAVGIFSRYGGPPKCNATGATSFDNITIRNLRADGVISAYYIDGLDDGTGKPPIQGVTLENVTVTRMQQASVCRHADVKIISGVHPPVPVCNDSFSSLVSWV